MALVCAVSALFSGLGSFAGIVCLLTSVCLVGMGFGCVIAGLFSELMIRQNKLPTAREHIVSDTETL